MAVGLTETVGVLAARDIMAAILAIAGLAKVADFAGFARTISGLLAQPAFGRIAHPIAGLVIASELGLSALVLSGVWPRLTNIGLLLMAVGFAAISVYGSKFRRTVSCRCFGSLSAATFGAHSVIRSAVLMLIAATLVGLDVRARVPYGPPGWANLFAVTAFGVLGLVAAQAASAIATIRST